MEGMLEPGVRDSREDDNQEPLKPLNLADHQVRLASTDVAIPLQSKHDY
jgi:PP-loop superfamily ATP-utilizing enzyme